MNVARDAGRSTPNLRATQVEVYEGLVANSQNRWPSLDFDVRAINDLVSPLLPAAFYYKTFMWPRFAWHRWYEPAIRRAAGLGRAPTAPDPDRYAQRYAHCDVLVVGGGPGRARGRPHRGGSRRARDALRRAGRTRWLAARRTRCNDRRTSGAAVAGGVAGGRLRARPNVTVLARTTAFGYFPHNMLGLVRTRHRSPCRARGRLAARAPVAGAGPRDRAGDRLDRAAAGISRQRPAGRDAGVRGEDLSAPIRRGRR